MRDRAGTRPPFRPARLPVEALAPIERELASLPITPAERAEALLVLLGVGVELTAAALGVSPSTIRARRRRIATRLGLARSGGALDRDGGTSLPARSEGAA